MSTLVEQNKRRGADLALLAGRLVGARAIPSDAARTPDSALSAIAGLLGREIAISELDDIGRIEERVRQAAARGIECCV